MDRSPGRRLIRRAAARVHSSAAAAATIAIRDAIAASVVALRQPGPLVGVTTLALLFVLLAAAGFGWTGRTWRLVPLLTIFALVVVIDLRVRLVPDVLTAVGLVYALALAAAAGSKPLLDAVIGTLVAGGVLLLLALVSRGQVGGGDVKLAAVLGAALGWQVALVVIALAEAAAGLVALIALAALRRRPSRLIPVGAVMALFGAVALIVTS